MARLRVNNVVTKPFRIARGTRQGCPLSPLLFALAIEPLAALLRSDVGIKGCSINDREEKTSLYADDMLLYLADAGSSLTSALDRISGFGVYSGFKVNWSKSVVFPFSSDYVPLMPPEAPLQVVPRFRYLGIEIQLPLNTYTKNNLFPLVSRLKESLQFWNKLPLNLLGRVNIYKMIYLPRFLYVLWHAPIYLPKKLFTNINALLLPFLWGAKPARVSLDTVYAN